MFKKGLKMGLIAGAVLAFLGLGYVYYVSYTSIKKNQETVVSKNFEELNISLTDLEGKDILLDQFREKKILVNIWGTWCAPCIKEMPFLQEVYDEIKENHVFILISDESPEKVKKFINKNQYDFEFLLTKKDLISVIKFFPTIFILDENKTIRKSIVGSLDRYSKKEFIELLAK